MAMRIAGGAWPSAEARSTGLGMEVGFISIAKPAVAWLVVKSEETGGSNHARRETKEASKVRQKGGKEGRKLAWRVDPLNFLVPLMALRNFSPGVNCLFVEIRQILSADYSAKYISQEFPVLGYIDNSPKYWIMGYKPFRKLTEYLQNTWIFPKYYMTKVIGWNKVRT